MATAPNFGAASVPALNPITAQIPNFAVQQMQAQRQQAIAQALMQQGMAPIDYDSKGRISWTQGLAKMLQAYEGTKMGNDAITQQAALQQQGMQAQGQALGMGQPSPSQYALGQGAQAGSVGPTNENAARLAAALSPAQKQGVNGAVMGTPYNPTGLPPQLLMSAQYGDPVAKAQLETLLKNFEHTPEIKNGQYMGQSPGQMLANTQAKAASDAFHTFAPGESWTNTLTGAGGFSPKVPDYSQPSGTFTPGSPIPSVAPVPGSQPVVQDNSRATARGATAGGVHTITNPDGSSTTGLGSDLFSIPPAVQAGRDSDALAILQQERAKPTNSAADNAALDREIARAGGGRVATGPAATDSGIQKAGADVIANLPQSASQAMQVRTSLENALKSLQGTKSGPGAAGSFGVTALLQNIGLPIAKSPTENWQTLNKYLNNGLSTAALINGNTGSDARMAQFSHGMPNSDLMNKAPLDEAIRYVLSQNDAVLAASQFIKQRYDAHAAQGDPRAALNAQSDWRGVYDPRVFEFSRMSPEQQQQFRANMQKKDPAAAAAFGQKYNLFHQNGWVQ